MKKAPATVKSTAVILHPGESREMSFGGGLEGAERTKRETALWSPPMVSPDRAINPGKKLADARGKDMVLNDGYTQGAVRIQKDSIVGASYRLNAKPDYRVICGTDAAWAQEWAEEFAAVAESRFNLAAESEDGWFDASGQLTFTGMLRLWVGAFCYTGEIIGTSEWEDSDPSRPFKTCIQMISPDRLCNRDGLPDGYDPRSGAKLSRGVEMDRKNRPIRFHFRRGYETDWDNREFDTWDIIEARKPWGRRQVVFVRDPNMIDQTRGISEMVAALGHSNMTKTYSELVLQKAVVDASYAAAVESEMPNADVIAAMGGGEQGIMNAVGQYMSMLQDFLGASENIAIDGVKMPHLFPGTKLNILPMGTPGGIGSDFEDSLIRKLAATFGVGFSEMSRNFAKFNYSGIKAEMALIERTMNSKKKFGADRAATQVYQLWVEEEIAQGHLPLPRGRNRTDFYKPLMKDAYTRCSWIASGRGQVDELKETQAAMLRIKAGLSTYEKEASRLGEDWRELAAQRAKEEKVFVDLNLPFSLDAQRAGNNEARNTMQGGRAGAGSAQDQDDADADEDEDTDDE
jgi:lambda family phage portal protein